MDRTPRQPERVIAGKRRRRPTKSGVVLSHELIVDTAIRLLNQGGDDALTVRRLGTALGADPSSIYRYFRGTDDLVLAVADELIGRTLAGTRPGGGWRERLRLIGEHLHATYVAHPRVALLAASRVTRRPNEIRAVERGLGIFREAGFPPDHAARHYHQFVDLTLGFAALDAAANALPPEAAAADRAAWTATYARLDPRTHPHISACAGPLAKTMVTSAYPGALALFLDGLEARLAEVTAPGRDR
ncbi:TetR/AcrR family transcriptional regulator [Actinomadura opuntiae]|uniref:TetR/AcrR family transcriptional regulator n=1 Tax=Actinomadura sp. OS1-43 TaxID=604315 RepID=UPI00255ACF1C|nr:TetR/AcrR family transcriptional regulator [Actinomadura sp. OS1-43]MDL4820806.1 TetR/AcrR family transcriptional regulator [Actinomadura sp. OS1-43]